MRAVDRVATEEVGFGLLPMMENAGRTLAWHAADLSDGPVLVLAGSGGNGGGGLVAARHLANHGRPVTVGLDRDPADLAGAAARQYRVLEAMGPDGPALGGAVDPTDGFSLIVDALVGYGLGGPLHGRAGDLVDASDRADATVLSLDVPSGVDATEGAVHGAAVQPDRILTLALPKTGLVELPAPVTLADIGIPATVYDRVGIAYEPPFGDGWWTGLERVRG